jgi:tRNA pseudouridine55 synthase
LVRFLPHSPKEYVGLLRLGVTTRTDDTTGEVLARHDGSLPPASEVLQAARTLLGPQLQEPPAVSARKVGGKRLYRLARRGQEVQAAPAEIEVLTFDLEPEKASGTYRFVARVSAGTYIRALARDLGRLLGCGGALAALRRTAVGPMTPDSRLTLEADEPPDSDSLREALIPLERMPLTPPTLRLAGAEEALRFLHGGIVQAPPGASAAEGAATVLSPGGNLLGIAEAEGTKLIPKVVLPPGEG